MSNKHRGATEVVSFRYPEAKKRMLQKLYGSDLSSMLCKLADTLLPEEVNQQLELPLTVENIKETKNPTGVVKKMIDNIRLLLRQGNIKQKHIATLVGVCESTVSNVKYQRYKKYENKEGGMVLEDNTP